MPADSAPPPFLCCVCQEKNTTFRYEVVCQDNIALLQLPQVAQPSSISEITGALASYRSPPADDPSFENEYYNFPPRHPSHGHLKACNQGFQFRNPPVLGFLGIFIALIFHCQFISILRFFLRFCRFYFFIFVRIFLFCCSLDFSYKFSLILQGLFLLI